VSHLPGEQTTPPISAPPSRLTQRLGLDTLRGRFLLAAAILVGSLVILATLVGNRVREVSQDNTVNLAERHRVYEMTHELSNEIWEAEQLLQHYLLQPAGAERARYDTLLEHVVADTETLTHYDWVRQHPREAEQIRQLGTDLRALRANGLRLMDVRVASQRTFPGMPTILNRMQPASLNYLSAANLALDEARDRLARPGQIEVLQIFYDCLYSWARMTDAFRLFIANRFGIFDTSVETAMQAQASVVEDFHERLLRNLARLAALEQAGRLEMQQTESLVSMRTLHQQWYHAWHDVQTIWVSESWRLDTRILQNDIQPLAARTWQNVRALERAVNANSAEDMALLGQVATHLSESLWLVVLLGLVVFGLMFLMFETQIRRPIARVVTALKAEAAGSHSVLIPDGGLIETRDLTQAFDHMRREVRSRQSRLEAVLHYAAESIITIDERGLIESFNPAAEQLFGYNAAEVLGNNVSLLMLEPHRREHDGYLQRHLGAGEKRVTGQAREVEAVSKDGRLFPVEINVSEMWVDGRRLFTGMIADISERKAMLEQLELTLEQLNTREQRLHTILNNTAEGIITFDEQGMIEGFNQSAEKLFGWVEDEVIGSSIARLISPEAREVRDDYLEHFMRAEIQRLIGYEGELVGRHKDGSSFPMAVKISGMWLENRQKYIAMVSNISERKALMENLRKLAEHDGLTGLYNRTYFHGELARVVERVHRSEVSNCALLYIDLDHFKYVNDTLGHAAGDTLLIEVANILTRRARKSDLVARLGGDEFTVLLYDTQPEQVEMVADSFRRQLADFNFSYEGQTVSIGCSIGVAMIEPSAQSPTEAMSRSDLACHIAKRSGRNQVHVFAPEDAKDVTTMSLDMGWSRRIREAVEHNRFALACQPIVCTRTREIKTYEVLIRMLDEHGGLIMPGGFLPTAERFGLSPEIDRWVITNAIETLAEQRATLPELCYTINLSAQTLNTPTICDLIQDKLRTTGLDPAALIFEITETAAIADLSAAAALLARLRALGCRTALDDFGSGMSSFAYLRELPVDIVKIDGRFVKHIATSAVDKAMVRAMNDIAHALGKETIAEFVENEDAFQILIELGVDHGQGYHLGRPELIAPYRALAAHTGQAGFCRI